MARRHFGSVRRRSSGRWQATYRHEGEEHSLGSFATKSDALAGLAAVEVDIRRGSWVDPRAGEILLAEYANEWLESRPNLAVRTVELYRSLLDRHLVPELGNLALADISPSKVRSWNARVAAGRAVTGAKAYRLLSSIMRTAVTDGLIVSSPCRVEGAGVEHPSERPIAGVAEIEALADAMPERMRLVVLLAAWCQLRRGELLGLRRRDVAELHGVVMIQQSRTFTLNGKSLVKAPKTRAGLRALAVPSSVMAELVVHLERFVDAEPDALVFTGLTGVPLTAGVLHKAWNRARSSAGRPDLHLHDLRHSGLTLAASAGATTAELMRRAGHASAEAALRYQHATRERDRSLAEALAALRPDRPGDTAPPARPTRAVKAAGAARRPVRRRPRCD